MSAEDTQPYAAPRFASGFPRAFGQYVLCASLGQGGMGEVFLAKHGGIAGLEHLCIIKKIHAQQVSSQKALGRFIDEARISIHMKHGNLCHVFDVGEVDGDYFLAMEYVAGVDLRMLLRRAVKTKAAFPAHLACHIVTEALDPLVYAHRLRHPVTGDPLHLVHRDISPHNIMIDYEGGVKLIDFGIASSGLKQERTESHHVVGKVSYMSPEQARGEQVDATTDQFAMAMVATELLVRGRFYGQMTAHEIWQQVGKGGFRPQGFDAIHEPVRHVLDRALAPSPERRFRTTEDFREALLDAVSEQPRTGRKVLREWIQGLFAQQLEQERRFVALCNALDTSRYREADVAGAFDASADKTETSQSPVPMPSAVHASTSVPQQSGVANSGPFRRAIDEPLEEQEPSAAETVSKTLTSPLIMSDEEARTPQKRQSKAAVLVMAVVLALGAVVLVRALWNPNAEPNAATEPPKKGDVTSPVVPDQPQTAINEKESPPIGAPTPAESLNDAATSANEAEKGPSTAKPKTPQKVKKNGRSKSKRASKKKTRTQGMDEHQPQPSSTKTPNAPAQTGPSLQEQLRVLQSCSRKCAQVLNERFKGNHVFVTADQRPAIAYCARRCAE